MNTTRKLCNLGIVILLMAALFPAAQPAAAQSPAPQGANDQLAYVPGELIVGFSDNIPANQFGARANALAGRVGAMVSRQFSNLAVFSFPEGTDLNAAAQQISASGQTAVVQPNYLYYPPETDGGLLGDVVTVAGFSIPTAQGSTYFTNEELAAMRTEVKGQATPTFPLEYTSGANWGWQKISADLVWSNPTANPAVCLLDSGVDAAHPDLSGMITAGYDFVNGDTKPDDDNGHGTHLAGIISAKLNNTGKDPATGAAVPSAAGVSKAKVINVKVLNERAIGTTFSVASGIIYCANNTTVKVINMSFGTSANDPLMYRALRYATSARGDLYSKLIVAASGNSSQSTPFYPAAWSNRFASLPVGFTDSAIYGRIISVGATGAPLPVDETTGLPLRLWVDRNGNDSPDGPDEYYDGDQCAWGLFDPTSGVAGSNYGQWVDIVAPGANIYSTTPVNYPFFLNQFNDVPAGYAEMSGTSAAAAFVSGAAARVWNTIKFASIDNPPNIVKGKLISTGDELEFAVDTTTAGSYQDTEPFNAAAGWNNPASQADYQYGVVTDTGGLIPAPFCWPGWEGSTPLLWTESQNMQASGAKALNLAKAMNLGALMVEVKDAATGLPLTGASVQAYQTVAGKLTLRDTALTSGKNTRALLINLPAGIDNYSLKINKAGYTTGAQTFNTGLSVAAGQAPQDVYSSISLAPATNLEFVLDWINPYTDGVNSPNLDMYLWLPKNVAGKDASETDDMLGGIIGPEGDNKLLDYYTGTTRTDLETIYRGAGTLQPASKFISQPTAGVKYFEPYALHTHDGGMEIGIDEFNQMMNPAERMTIALGASGGTFTTALGALNPGALYRPKYTYAATGNREEIDYALWVTDYSQDHGGVYNDQANYLNPADDLFTYPVVRVWSKGILVRQVRLIDGACGSGGEWWNVLTVRGDTPLWARDPGMSVNTCHNNPNFPYASE